MTKINSRDKGARGEREAAGHLKDEYGFQARRGVQHAGGPDSPDVVHSIPGVHLEVKRVEDMKVDSKLLDDAMEQAVEDSPPSHLPVVMWRRNRMRWQATWLFQVKPPREDMPDKEIMVTADLEDFLYARGFPKINP